MIILIVNACVFCLVFKKAKHDRIWTRFLIVDCQTVYYKDLARRKVLHEWGISLEKVTEKIPAFYQWLQAMGWSYFAPEPCKANEKWVQEFYTNLKALYLSNPIMMIREKMVNFGSEVINEL